MYEELEHWERKDLVDYCKVLLDGYSAILALFKLAGRLERDDDKVAPEFQFIFSTLDSQCNKLKSKQGQSLRQEDDFGDGWLPGPVALREILRTHLTMIADMRVLIKQPSKLGTVNEEYLHYYHFIDAILCEMHEFGD